MRTVIVSGLIALTVLMLAVAYVNSDTSVEQANNSSVVSVSPTPGGLHSVRGDIVVDLADGLTGRLVINSIVIPDDEVIAVQSEGLYTFRPGAGKVIEEFAAGPNTAEVVFWPQGEPEPPVAESYTWEFRVSL